MTLKKIAASVASAAFAFTVMAAPASAMTINATIRDNGAFSWNKIEVKVFGGWGGWSVPSLWQKNVSSVNTTVVASSNTGGNSADLNTTNGGNVTENSGDATVGVSITNNVGTNVTP